MASASKVSSNAIKALKQFTTCDIGDSLVKLGFPYGGFLSGIHMWSPSRQAGPSKIFGPAYTVRMVDASDETSPKPPSHFVDCIPKDSVVFISQPKGYYSACWGGLMSTRAQRLGAQGVIIDGSIRDVNEHRDLKFPLFAKGISILGSNSFTRSSELNVPVQFSSECQPTPLAINPGDLIMGDADGVVVVPPSLVEQCVELCRERFEIDEQTRRLFWRRERRLGRRLRDLGELCQQASNEIDEDPQAALKCQYITSISEDRCFRMV